MKENIKAPCHWPFNEGNSPVTGEFPTQKARNAEDVSIWWRHHGGDIFNMSGRSWRRLTGHRMPQSTTQKSWPITCCRTGVLRAIRELLNPFCWTITVHPTKHGLLRHTWLNTMWSECSPGLPRSLILSALDVWNYMKPKLKWHITVNTVKPVCNDHL